MLPNTPAQPEDVAGEEMILPRTGHNTATSMQGVLQLITEKAKRIKLTFERSTRLSVEC